MVLRVLKHWLKLPAALRRRGVLGINCRNSEYVLPSNPRRYYPRLDNKLLTKQFCGRHDIRVPQTYAVIHRHGDLRRLGQVLEGREDFVVKPCQGAEGRGIIVVVGRQGDTFITAGGERMPLTDLAYHTSTVLAGLYSLGGQPDSAIIEQRIIRHQIFERIAVGGTPDVRIVLYRTVPVMAMVRLPTVQSRGRANLHQGAVAAGIQLATGQTLGGVCQQRAVDRHPDTGESIAGHAIPAWPQLLEQATRLARALEMGYIGVDFVLDAAHGPVILEANARPGLAIQVANRRGLLPRLRLVDAWGAAAQVPQRRGELTAALAEL